MNSFSDMQVALVRQKYNPYGGAERFVERALAALRSDGVDVSLIARHWHGDVDTVIRCDPFFFGNVWRDWSFARCVSRTLRSRTFTLVQSHERIAGCDIYRAGDGVHLEWLRRRRASLGMLARFGTLLNPYHWYVRNAEQRMYADTRLKAVICNSRMVRDEIRRSFALHSDKLHVIYNGIDTTTFTPGVRESAIHVRSQLNIPAAAAVFLFVGSGFARKGLCAVIDALPKDAHLIVVGKDRRARRYQAAARRAQAAARVHFVGGQADVRPYYGAADAFVLPALYEPFSSAVLEAMACGLPAVTTVHNGAAEAIVDGVSGYICDRPGGIRLAQILQRLCDRKHARQLGLAALAAAQAFDMTKMTRELQALYARLLAEHVSDTL